MDEIGVSLLSGGLDSTIVTTYAKSQLSRLTALTFHYGQTHANEINASQKVADLLCVHHELADITAYGKIAWYSSLTSPDRFPIPVDRTSEEIIDCDDTAINNVPSTYVPLRNTFFLTLAGALLESHVLQAIEVMERDPTDVGAYIYIAPNAIDYSGYPDCRPEYYKTMCDALMVGSKLWTQYRVPIQIKTPIIHLSKAEIVKWGIALGAPLEYTWSCYQEGELPCGRCDSCSLRAKGFSQAGLPDPLLARLGVTRT